MSRFRPDFIVGISCGGAPVGIAMQKMWNISEQSPIASAPESLLAGIGSALSKARVPRLDYLVDNLNAKMSF